MTRAAALLGALNTSAIPFSRVSGITGKVKGRWDMPTDREASRTPKSQARAADRAGDVWCLGSPAVGQEALITAQGRT